MNIIIIILIVRINYKLPKYPIGDYYNFHNNVSSLAIIMINIYYITFTGPSLKVQLCLLLPSKYHIKPTHVNINMNVNYNKYTIRPIVK